MKVGILTNGTITDYDFYKEKMGHYDLVICADGGLTHAIKMDVIPQVALGDFDSTPDHVLKFFRSKGTKIITYPAIKNATDTEIALGYAMAQNPASIDILAGLGSRFDHSLGNVHLLRKALDKGMPCTIVTKDNEIRLIDKEIEIEGLVGDGVSLLPLTGCVRGVYTTGLGYPIKNGEFCIGSPYGISNYMTHIKARIKISSGLLLVMKFWE